jgi:hypothetical protein
MVPQSALYFGYEVLTSIKVLDLFHTRDYSQDAL